MDAETPVAPALVGFPPPLLGARPLRLPVLHDAPEWCALDKPAGVGTRAHPWDAAARDLDTALNVQLQAGKRELAGFAATLFGSIYYLDADVSGIVVFAKTKEAVETLRNRFGSRDGRFTFRFVARDVSDLSDQWTADAPLLPHNVKPKMIPSTAKGKKCETHFRRLAVSGEWAHWEAICDFFRPHQIRAHAAAGGIPILGDTLYDGPAVPTLADLESRKKRRAGLVKPAYQGLPIRLCTVCLDRADPATAIEAGPDKLMELFLKRLGLGG